jgi:hypothetical protein
VSFVAVQYIIVLRHPTIGLVIVYQSYTFFTSKTGESFLVSFVAIQYIIVLRHPTMGLVIVYQSYTFFTSKTGESWDRNGFFLNLKCHAKNKSSLRFLESIYRFLSNAR